MRRGLSLFVLAVCAIIAVVTMRPGVVRPDIRPPGFRADVMVVGGSPAGVTAALAAARQGMVVVLLEPRPFLGSVWTGAMLNMLDLSRSADGRPLIRGIFMEISDQIGGVTFDPRVVRATLQEKVEAEPGITLLLGTRVLQPEVEDRRVLGATVLLPDGSRTSVTASVTIDATDDGDFAGSAGVPFTVGREGSGIDKRTMPATLLFRLVDVNWREIIKYTYAHRRGRHPSGAFQGSAWGFFDLMRDYTAEDRTLSAHDLNIGRLPDGSVMINALQIHDLDGTNRESRSEGYARAKREIPHMVEFFRQHLPGFSHARLVEIAPELYVRETRHFKGVYTLTVTDIATHTHFWDSIGAASYPVDLHQYVPGERYAFRVVRRPYTIPLRALITASVDGLFLVSRAFSATYQAAGSARVVPTTMAMGEGAGVAAAVSVLHGVTPHALAERRDLVANVQERLVRSGAVIDF
jgi:glycine/D-amino acid oxidase-like deaminating enzyme